MHTLQNDMITQIMAKHIRQRKYIDIFRLGVGCIIVFVGGVRGGVGARVCLGSCCMWPPMVLCGRAASIRGVVFVVLGLFAYVTDVT